MKVAYVLAILPISSIFMQNCRSNSSRDFDFHVGNDGKALTVFIEDRDLWNDLQENRIYAEEMVQVFTEPEEPTPGDLTVPILGEYELGKREVVFKPLLGFRHDVNYRVVYNHRFGKEFLYKHPESNIPSYVKMIFPSADTLPHNLLKWYIYFTGRMSEGQAYDHIYLIDQRSDTVNEPFVRLEPELWSNDNTRLTIWMDPGRVKRELEPNLEKGTPLQKDEYFTLRIDPNWLNATGIPLEEGFEKLFFVEAADRKKPDIKNWEIVKPSLGTKEPLQIKFQEPLDHALAINMVDIFTHDSKEVAGHKELLKYEYIWLFNPVEKWTDTTYRLRINTFLEDLAGNNLNRLFDTDLLTDQYPDTTFEFQYLTIHLN